MIHDILDLHTHTIMSGHAYSTMQEMIRSASEKDVKLLGITEHAPRIPGACHPFYFINFKVVPREQFGVKLILGCELNIIDYEGHIDLEPRYLNGLDYAVASIHEPCYDSGTVAQNTAAYLGAMKIRQSRSSVIRTTGASPLTTRLWSAPPKSIMSSWRSIPVPCTRNAIA